MVIDTDITSDGDDAEGAAELGATWKRLLNCPHRLRISGSGSTRVRAETQTRIFSFIQKANAVRPDADAPSKLSSFATAARSWSCAASAHSLPANPLAFGAAFPKMSGTPFSRVGSSELVRKWTASATNARMITLVYPQRHQSPNARGAPEFPPGPHVFVV
jgi:hypothetical protein